MTEDDKGCCMVKLTELNATACSFYGFASCKSKFYLRFGTKAGHEDYQRKIPNNTMTTVRSTTKSWRVWPYTFSYGECVRTCEQGFMYIQYT